MNVVRSWPIVLALLLAACQTGGVAPGSPASPGPSAPATPMSAPTAVPVPAGPMAGVTAFSVAPGGEQGWSAPASAVRLVVSGTHGSASGPAFALTRPAAAFRVAAATLRSLGEREAFWVNTGDSTPAGDVRQAAVLTRISANAYFYLDEAARRPSEAQWDALVAAFEQTIYPRVTAVFGPEARPGVDGDERLSIVVSPAVHGLERDTDVLAYFWSRDAIPGSTDAHSNQKEVLFLSDKLFSGSPLLTHGAVAHELQHLINFTRKGALLGYQAKEATWLDEGLSMYAMEAAGYGLKEGERLVANDVRAFLADPSAYSLTDWGTNPNGYSFGQSYLFVRYLVDRHGESVLRELLATPKLGTEAIDTVLKPRGDGFEPFFRAWAIANLISGTPAAEGTPYRYATLDLRGTYGGVTLPGITPKPTAGDVSARLKPWSSAYYTLPGQAGALRLQDTGGTGLLGALIVP